MLTLEMRDLRKSYRRRPVLSGLSHRFGPGLTLLVGRSGAGKSTLLRLLATAERPDDGSLSWCGESLPRARRRLRASLGYAPQAVDLPDDLTAREFAGQMAALKGLERSGSDEQFLHIAARLGLGADVGTRIAGWSGGMRRRLILAQALIGAPELLILDEPTAELDRQNAILVEELILERAASSIVVMTSHQPDRLADAAVGVVSIGGEAAT